MAWPSTKSTGDTLAAAADWNLIINNACRKDASNNQFSGVYDLTGAGGAVRDGTAFNGMFFDTANTRFIADNTVRVCIDADNGSTDQKFEIVKDTSAATGGTTLFEVREDGSIKAPNLPTSDPGEAGVLWNDAGVVTVSSG